MQRAVRHISGKRASGHIFFHCRNGFRDEGSVAESEGLSSPSLRDLEFAQISAIVSPWLLARRGCSFRRRIPSSAAAGS